MNVKQLNFGFFRPRELVSVQALVALSIRYVCL